LRGPRKAYPNGESVAQKCSKFSENQPPTLLFQLLNEAFEISVNETSDRESGTLSKHPGQGI
jgi:hypothetical protein